MWKRETFVLIAVCVLVAGSLAAQSSPAGKWKMTIAFPQGNIDAGLDVKVSGKAVTGKFIAAFAGGEVPIEGELQGDKLTFSAATTGGPHPGMQLDFSGTLKEDRMTGKVDAFFGSVDFTAERQP